MQPRPSFDRELLIPIAIGVVSILGIVWIFSTSNLGTSLITPAAIPSSFSFLEAGTLTPSPTAPPTQDEPPLTATEISSPDAYPGPPAEILPSTSTLIMESLLTPSVTHPPDKFKTLSVGKYDDTDPNILYDSYWIALKNPGTANAYKGTLHISASIGHEASFRFTGKRFQLGYQRGKNFGIVTVIIDDQPYGFHDQAPLPCCSML